jgi:hypothetical protein
MKKVIAAVFAMSLASSAMATVGVDFGTNWYKVSYTDNVGDHLSGQGQNFLVSWTLDNDLSLGAYTESGVWTYYSGSADEWEIRAIQISKGVVKNVAVGMNHGVMINQWDSGEGQLTDVFGAVTILGGSGDKVSGALKTTVGARFNVDDGDYDFSGITVNLSVGLAF